MHRIACVVALLTPASYCFSWAKSVWSTSPPNSLGENSIADLDISLIVGQSESLERYGRDRDCFKLAAERIKTRCGELEMNEDERIKAAVSMTLCELATARHNSLPLECSLYATAADEMSSASSTETLRGCVEALSRSAQYWSSYSGYLREVPQLCYAFRRWNDIDTARDIYKNATLAKVVLLKQLAEHEARLQEDARASAQILNDVHTAVVAIQSSSASVKVASSQIPGIIRAGLEDSLDAYKKAMFDLVYRSQEAQTDLTQKAESSMKILQESHGQHLEGLVLSLHDSLRSQMEDLFLYLRNQYGDVLSVVDEMQLRSTSLVTQLSTMHHRIDALLLSTASATQELDAQLVHAASMHQAQVVASSAVVHLAESLTHLTDKMQAEIESINSTAIEVRDNLLAGASGDVVGLWTPWARSSLAYILEIIFRVNPVAMEYLVQLPMVRVLAACLTVALYGLRLCFSSIMSAFLLLMSARRWGQKYSMSNMETECFDPLAIGRISPMDGLATGCSHLSYPGTGSEHNHLTNGSQGLPSYSRRQRARPSRIPERLLRPTADTPWS